MHVGTLQLSPSTSVKDEVTYKYCFNNIIFVVPPTQGRCEPVNGQIRLKQTETENEIIR